MALTAGTKLGPYEIQSPLGAGGMGEVYRARDSRLERTVAIKILPSHLSSSPEAKQRFEREARTISSLSHPNLCHLYDVGCQDGSDYLVMEFLEGETLADRLRKGPLALEQVLKVGIELCEGLEKAHRSGVIHRDLKPGNMMLTKSGAKLMDFGLAKAVTPSHLPSSGMTQTFASAGDPLTAQGMVVGTFQYISPEQVEGQDADARSDIFALGAVLYEMATGKRAFEGKTSASTIAAILAADPKPISAVQPLTPPALERLVKNCLAKDPDERVQTVHDVKLQLKSIAEGGSQTSLPSAHASRKNRERVGWWVAGLLLLLLVGVGGAWWFRARQKKPTMYFNAPVSLLTSNLTLSPNGQTLAMVAYSDQENKYMIWTYKVGSRETVSVPGTDDAIHPFWSPDSRSLAFFAQGKLKKVDISSGASIQVICDAPHGRGGAWNKDGVIIFTPDTFTGLFRIPASGGSPTQITHKDPSKQEQSHRWPVFLPDGKHFLYMSANFGGQFEHNAIYVGALDSDEKHFVLNVSSNTAYAEPGYLLYWRDGALVAQHFDSSSYTVSGEPRIISAGVQYFPQTDLALFSVVGQGLLVFQTGKGVGKSQLVWFDRNGKQTGVAGPPGLIENPAISPDGRRLLFGQTDRDGRHVDIWVRDVNSDGVTRLTFGPGLNEQPVWSSDGKRIGYGANQTIWGLMETNADGSGSPQHLTDAISGRIGFWDWSRDGKYQLIGRDEDLWYLPLADRQPKPLVESKWITRNAQFSPDGKWVAYCSNETGNWEIFVTPFPSANAKWQVSQGGGEEPRWRRDGKELFYLSPERKIMAVTVKAGQNFEAGQPVALFQTHLHQPISAMDVVSYDVTADGQKFLINTKVDEPNASPFSIILNWASEMED